MSNHLINILILSGSNNPKWHEMTLFMKDLLKANENFKTGVTYQTETLFS